MSDIRCSKCGAPPLIMSYGDQFALYTHDGNCMLVKRIEGTSEQQVVQEWLNKEKDHGRTA